MLETTIPPIDWGWDQAGYLAEWHEPYYDVLARYVPAGARILEVGAGASHTLACLVSRLDCRGFGIEPDEAGLRNARRHAEANGRGVGLVRGDGFALPFGDGAFEVVYSLGLIEHFSPDRSAGLVAEHARVCRPGGRVIVSVPNFWNLPHTLNKAVMGARYPYHPERSYTPRRLRAVFESVGLRVVAVDGVLPLWGLSMISWGWRVRTALDRLGITRRLDEARSPRLRATLGYMTFAIGERPVSS